MSTWTNWAQSASADPSTVAHPATTAEVVALVRKAAAAGKRVKAIGAGHSFTPIGAMPSE